ncbi:MAG TPA: GAF domain-containing protein [Alphaproteobacteria bacterium]|jgi:GAF domain-containing protein|nr:GAF domain-containing protein [Alphaproteobacteria bacterium]
MNQTKTEFYQDLAAQLTGLIGDERDRIANAANMSAFLFMCVPDLNWAGFYFLGNGGLIVGPFQGKPACVRIAVGDGVCGTAVKERRTILVENVHEFPGHIACDAGSESELVVPLVKDGEIIGVLDLDSPRLARFDAEDQAGMERLARIFVEASD